MWTEAFRGVFKELDTDNNGIIDIKELEEHFGDEKMLAYFASLEVDVCNAWTLFKLLDQDGQGSIDLEEFVVGLMQLKGYAKAIHVAQLHRDNTMTRRKVEDFISVVECQLSAIIRAMDARDICRLSCKTCERKLMF